MNLATSLAGAGIRPVVLTSAIDVPLDDGEPDGVRVHRVIDDWRIGAAGLRSLRTAREIMRSEEVDVVHVLFPDSEVDSQYQIPALLAGTTPLVTTFWNLALGRRSPTALRLSSLALLARSTVLSSHDPFYVRQLRRVALKRPVRWLPVGSNVEAAPTASTPVGIRQLAYFGQLDTTRGVDDLFEAVSLLRRRGRGVRLLMIGSAAREERYAESARAVWGEYQRLRALPDALGITDLVEWTPYLSGADVSRLLAESLCVLPYRRNSIGRSALAAAFAAGAPVALAGDRAAIEPLEAGRHVELIPRGDAPGQARSIETILDDPELEARLRAGSREAARLFAWPRIAAAAASMYEEALASRS